MTPATPATPLPWRLEQDTDLIWGACNPDDRTTHGMGYPIVEGHPGSSWAVDRKPSMDDREQNAAYIVEACNAYPDLLAALYQYRDDLRYPPAPDSVTRRLAMIDALIAKAAAREAAMQEDAK